MGRTCCSSFCGEWKGGRCHWQSWSLGKSELLCDKPLSSAARLSKRERVSSSFKPTWRPFLRAGWEHQTTCWLEAGTGVSSPLCFGKPPCWKPWPHPSSWDGRRVGFPLCLAVVPSLYQLLHTQTSCFTHPPGELLGELWRPGFVLYFGWWVSDFFAVTNTRPSLCAAGRA